MAHRARGLKDEPGTLQFEVLIPCDDKTKVMLYELYRDDAAFDAHWNASLARLRKEAGDMMLKAPAQGARSWSKDCNPSFVARVSAVPRHRRRACRVQRSRRAGFFTPCTFIATAASGCVWAFDLSHHNGRSQADSPQTFRCQDDQRSDRDDFPRRLAFESLAPSTS